MTASKEIRINRADKQEAIEILEFVMSLDNGNLHDFYQFTQGVNYALTLYNCTINRSGTCNPM